MSFTIALSHGTTCPETCPCKNTSSDCSIWTCACEGSMSMLQRRIEEKPNLVNKVDTYGYTALHYAAQHGHINIVKFLLSKGAIVDGIPAPDGCGATPLHRCGWRDICDILINNGADIDAIDTSFGDGRTSLMKAASQSRDDVVALLLSAGARTDIRDRYGKSYADLIADVLEADCLSQHSAMSLNSSIGQRGSVISFPADPLPTQQVCTSDGITCASCGQVAVALTKVKQDLLVCRSCKFKNIRTLL